MEPPYLCLLYVATAGEQGPYLGCDNKEIILLVYITIDARCSKVVGVQQYVVKPQNTGRIFLSQQILHESRLTKKIVKKGVSLETAITNFEEYVKDTLNIDPSIQSLRFVTDGQRHLRQCLHPEAYAKNVELPAYYNVFHDLRKEFRAFYEIPDAPQSILDMVTHLGMTPADMDSTFHVQEVKDMINIVIRMLAAGHVFQDYEKISLHLRIGVYSKNDEVDSNCVVNTVGFRKLRSDQDVADFFRGLNIEKGGVALRLSKGSRNGKAYVLFENQEQCDLALERHMRPFGHRYIQVYKSSGESFIRLVGGSNDEVQNFLSRGAQVIIKVNNIPHDCSATKVVNLFNAGENACRVMGDEEGVLFVKDAEGKATGCAFVLFALEEDADKALSKHHCSIDFKRVDVVRRTTAEVQQFFKRLDPEAYEREQQLISEITQKPVLPKNLVPVGKQQNCIRLRGLPFETQIGHIFEFLGDYTTSISFPGVYMIKDVRGLPCGEAFVCMKSEQSALRTAQEKHQKRMIVGNWSCYIEVYQCSVEDMKRALTCEIPVGAVSIIPPHITVLTPYLFPAGPALLNPNVMLTFPRTSTGGCAPTLIWPGDPTPVTPSFSEEGLPPTIPFGSYQAPAFSALLSAPTYNSGAMQPIPPDSTDPAEENHFPQHDDSPNTA